MSAGADIAAVCRSAAESIARARDRHRHAMTPGLSDALDTAMLSCADAAEIAEDVGDAADD